jgi:hypothetical protein
VCSALIVIIHTRARLSVDTRVHIQNNGVICNYYVLVAMTTGKMYILYGEWDPQLRPMCRHVSVTVVLYMCVYHDDINLQNNMRLWCYGLYIYFLVKPADLHR